MTREDQKKHNKEKVQEHLFLTMLQLANTQQSLVCTQDEAVNSREKLTAKVVQTGKDLASTKKHLIDTVKTVDRLIQRLQQTERDFQVKEELSALQLEKYKDYLTVKVDQMERVYKHQLADTIDELTEILKTTEGELATSMQKLSTAQEESKKTQNQLTKEFKQVRGDIASELTIIKETHRTFQLDAKKNADQLYQRIEDKLKEDQEIVHQKLNATQEDTKKTKAKLVQELSNTQTNLSSVEQQLATTCQRLSRAEKQLASHTDDALANLETRLQLKIKKIESASQMKIAELETKLEQREHQIDRLLEVTWTTNIASQAANLSSGDQVVPVIVKMSEFTKMKNDKVPWHSDSFYADYKRYKMCLQINAVGRVAGFLSVGVILMKDPSDDRLKWPLKGCCEVKLLNQISNKEHHFGNGKHTDDGQKRVTKREKSNTFMWYTHQFISNKLLHKITPTCQYLKDDSIFFRVDFDYCLESDEQTMEEVD